MAFNTTRRPPVSTAVLARTKCSTQGVFLFLFSLMFINSYIAPFLKWLSCESGYTTFLSSTVFYPGPLSSSLCLPPLPYWCLFWCSQNTWVWSSSPDAHVFVIHGRRFLCFQNSIMLWWNLFVGLIAIFYFTVHLIINVDDDFSIRLNDSAKKITVLFFELFDTMTSMRGSIIIHMPHRKVWGKNKRICEFIIALHRAW